MVLQFLVSNGYEVEFHKEHFTHPNALQLDLFLPKINVAIEIDGPTHFSPIWGEEALTRTQKADRHKEDILAGKNIQLIRIKHTKTLSQKDYVKYKKIYYISWPGFILQK